MSDKLAKKWREHGVPDWLIPFSEEIEETQLEKALEVEPNTEIKKKPSVATLHTRPHKSFPKRGVQ